MIHNLTKLARTWPFRIRHLAFKLWRCTSRHDLNMREQRLCRILSCRPEVSHIKTRSSLKRIRPIAGSFLLIAGCTNSLWIGLSTAYVPSQRHALPGRRESALAGGVAMMWPNVARAESQADQLDPIFYNGFSTNNTWPKYIGEFARIEDGLFGMGKKPYPTFNWQPFGTRGNTTGTSLAYPAWLEGTWEVQYKYEGRHFPNGEEVGRALSAAGVNPGSILRVPDVTKESKANWRFRKDSSGRCRADWEYTIPSILKSFVEAEILDVGQAETPDGTGLSIAYKQPSEPERKHATLAWLASKTWQDPKAKTFLSMEWQRQRGKVKAGASDVYGYKIYTSLRSRNKDDIIGLFRVASFLQPFDASFEAAKGQPAAIWDFSLFLKRVPTAVA
eukprot:TRINITY_DN87578_c0_g1_i1.p1 TRINITY_DN87578_c0_g1~~TRINITY_DN87578_c0_g1_i1.p1  ORF type:complete len:389 (-),score=47.67 TRINITY_DN87578_c0_g1_i1:308-1474(-)